MTKTLSSRVGMVGLTILPLIACSASTPPKPTIPLFPTPPPAASTPPPPARVSPVRRAASTAVHIDDDILEACRIHKNKAFFAFDSSRLEQADLGPLGQVAECFEHGPLRGRALKLIGRADPRGEFEYNMVLGQSRADCVGTFLEKKGLQGERIRTTSRGAMDATGTDEASWVDDRRVDIVLGSGG